MSAECKSCGAAIVWAVTKNGKNMPVDAAKTHGGTIDLVPNMDPREPPNAVVVPPSPTPRHRSHFATCPQAGSHRK